ncbi:uncharacterized protein EDB91DRAFT_1088515 [Suillus paluster]|uniref:uncharacterized protein n=1 Tax=Suillus paluster TaxID=48578 RepID=UPI001B8601F0|nr:uncharacterized protein EDB91DRAFT_1088515 [Suillus paluster]KAG1721247.1 hypothetical protein EDB91DRAFT_1088515 [Suillus paluster]
MSKQQTTPNRHAAPARIQRIYHNVNFHAHHLASPTQCVSFIQFTVHYSMFLSLVLVFSLCLFHVSPAVRFGVRIVLNIFSCLSVYLLFLASLLLVVGDLGACMRCMPLCMPLSHKTLMQHKFQKLSAVFDAGRHFYHLTLSQYDFQS